MADELALQPASEPLGLIASPLHLLGVIVFWALNTYIGAIRAAQSQAGMGPSRPTIYLRTMLFELVFLIIVVIGVRLRGASLQSVLGQRWRTALDMFRDLGVGIALLIASTLLVSIIGGHRNSASANQTIQFLLPQTRIEYLLWILLSVTAGICEEAIYRGYFQRQFTALTHNVPAGIVISGALFAGAHLYQGFSRAFVIFVSAILFGGIAHWRGTVRPGMFAHAIQDGVAPLLIKMMGR